MDFTNFSPEAVTYGVVVAATSMFAVAARRWPTMRRFPVVDPIQGQQGQVDDAILVANPPREQAQADCLLQRLAKARREEGRPEPH